jgi:uncharacterized repeat protein (TIGR03806 family)
VIAAIGFLLAMALQEQRIPWNDSKVVGSPDPPAPYHTEPAFPKLQFDSAVELVVVPGAGLLAVAELGGRIKVFPPDPAATEARTVLALGRSVLGLAFHPRFVENGFVYVVVEAPVKGALRLSRFLLRREQNWTGSIDSEQVLLDWPAHPMGHGGGGLRFGPDGFLYIGIGDGSEGSDVRATGQDLGDLLSSILRIDVDHPDEGRPYGVPKDNPFVGRAGARPEIWAYGVRQPWRMSWDRATGDFWVGNVGQDLWEMVLRVRRGGNYGWSVKEGTHPFRPDRAVGPTPILPPVIEHPHSEARAVVGGAVSRGSRLKELAGAYIYGDYETGKIWGLRLENDRVTWHRELAATHLRIVSFGEDEQGELYALNFPAGTIHRLVPGESVTHNRSFPRKLSDTGIFSSVRDLRPAPGVVPYEVNAPLWSDGADKQRLLALPGSSQIGFQDVPNRAFLEAPRGWGFPDGTVLVKTFLLGGRRVETRLLHLQKMGEGLNVYDYFWRGYSYEWNAEQSDAELVEAAGRTRVVGSQTWRFPSRTECMQCHSLSAQFVLGVTTLQMNRDVAAPGGGKVNQLTLLERLGFFKKPLPGRPADLGRLVDYADPNEDLDRRARSYLHANCAQCHTMFGGGNSAFQLQANLALPDTGILDAAPVHSGLGIPNARLLAPGDPARSLLLRRMSLSQDGRMPPLATSVVDAQGLALIEEWIRSLDPDRGKWKPLAGGAAVVALGAALLVVRRRRVRRGVPG